MFLDGKTEIKNWRRVEAIVNHKGYKTFLKTNFLWLSSKVFVISCTPLPFLLDIKGEISCLTFKVVLGANELNSSSDNSGLIKICFKKRNETKRRINLILFTSSEGGGGGGETWRVIRDRIPLLFTSTQTYKRWFANLFNNFVIHCRLFWFFYQTFYMFITFKTKFASI